MSLGQLFDELSRLSGLPEDNIQRTELEEKFALKFRATHGAAEEAAKKIIDGKVDEADAHWATLFSSRFAQGEPPNSVNRSAEELRAANDLARLWRNSNSGGDVRALLEPILEAVEGGADTRDVRNTHELLAGLA